MPKQNKRRTSRLKNLVVVSSLTAIVLAASTYAWFIGMRTVNVSSFDVEIASTDSLLLSLNGEDWDTTVSITQDTIDTVSYTGHTNSWGGAGLLPMSSIGAMDTEASRMKIYEKASLTTTPGGYRLLSSRVPNYAELATEQSGYVAFDLFIKNFSGTQYLETLNELDEEAIYLTTDSSVTVASTGVANTGIENSVRVAFAQIGRVKGTTTTPSKITGITCEADGEGLPSIINGVTGICRTAQIWEPNDVDHVVDAISWYNTSCRVRTGVNVTLPTSYGAGACGTVANGTAYPTYAVSNDITSANNVDVYDGLEYNTYENTTLLVAYPYFTDTMKDLAGTSRPTFMTFAPNSITKVRIYIYIEGQDVDNYDFASIGKKIAVKFGLTKERFTEDDINYQGPGLPGTDTEKPVITLLGDAAVTIALGSTYNDAGATAVDNIDGNMTTKIQTINPVNTAVAGVYIITYNVSDWAGNYAAQVIRTVTVE
ncbi:MAG: DUF5011 domain-containing protein [Bacilli bacterium]|nr:DUF5011 domain-containing protein [Bacilli bacterium]